MARSSIAKKRAMASSTQMNADGAPPTPVTEGSQNSDQETDSRVGDEGADEPIVDGGATAGVEDVEILGYVDVEVDDGEEMSGVGEEDGEGDPEVNDEEVNPDVDDGEANAQVEDDEEPNAQVEDTESNAQSQSKKPRRRSRKDRSDYKVYIHKVLKQTDPNQSISKNAIQIVNDFLKDIECRLSEEARTLCHKTKRATLGALDIQTAVRLVFEPDLGAHVVHESSKALIKYNDSTGKGGSRGGKGAGKGGKRM